MDSDDNSNVSGDEIKVEEVPKKLKPSVAEVSFPKASTSSHIKNKHVRTQQYQKEKREQKKVHLNK